MDARGDRVEIVIDAGGEVRTYEVVATRNGRRVEINTGRGVVEVTEVTVAALPFLAPNANEDIPVIVGNPEMSSDEPGDPHVRNLGLGQKVAEATTLRRIDGQTSWTVWQANPPAFPSARSRTWAASPSTTKAFRSH